MGADEKKQGDTPVDEKKEDAVAGKGIGGLADSFFLVIVGDDIADGPRLIESGTMDAFAKTVDEHVLNAKTPIHAFGFVGKRIRISSPAPICTVEVNGTSADVGRDDKNYEASGRITPLQRGVPE